MRGTGVRRGRRRIHGHRYNGSTRIRGYAHTKGLAADFTADGGGDARQGRDAGRRVNTGNLRRAIVIGRKDDVTGPDGERGVDEVGRDAARRRVRRTLDPATKGRGFFADPPEPDHGRFELVEHARLSSRVNPSVTQQAEIAAGHRGRRPQFVRKHAQHRRNMHVSQ